MKKTRCILFFLWLFALTQISVAQSRKNGKSFFVCGDSKVILVDYYKSRDSVPEIVWTWDAHLAKDLPAGYHAKFNSIDDCKPLKKGKQVLVSSSSGAVALVNRKDGKVLFYASVPNAHSIARIPGNRLVVAASTAKDGNKIILFDARHGEIPLFSDSLYSAHGLVWHKKRQSLFALGYAQLREYKIADYHNLRLINQWTIPGIGGHDLQLARDHKNLFVTEHGGSWIFDVKSQQFKKIAGFPDRENIKSLGQDESGQFIFTVPEESWWTFHVIFLKPARKIAFPGMRVYKARWVLRR